MKEITVYVIRNMNWQRSPETRCEYFLVRSNTASMRHTVSHNSSQSMFLTLSGTTMTMCVLYAGIAVVYVLITGIYPYDLITAACLQQYGILLQSSFVIIVYNIVIFLPFSSIEAHG